MTDKNPGPVKKMQLAVISDGHDKAIDMMEKRAWLALLATLCWAVPFIILMGAISFISRWTQTLLGLCVFLPFWLISLIWPAQQAHQSGLIPRPRGPWQGNGPV